MICSDNVLIERWITSTLGVLFLRGHWSHSNFIYAWNRPLDNICKIPYSNNGLKTNECRWRQSSQSNAKDTKDRATSQMKRRQRDITEDKRASQTQIHQEKLKLEQRKLFVMHALSSRLFKLCTSVTVYVCTIVQVLKNRVVNWLWLIKYTITDACICFIPKVKLSNF